MKHKDRLTLRIHELEAREAALMEQVKHLRERLPKEQIPATECKACARRARAGFDGQCPECAGERARDEMAAARAAQSGEVA